MSTNFQLAAEALADAFIYDKRADGETFIHLEDAPDWMTDAVRAAHGGRMPCDDIYLRCKIAADAIVDGQHEDADAARDASGEFADGAVDVYNTELAAWLAGDVRNEEWIEEARQNFGSDPDADTWKRLQVGQYLQLEHIYDCLVDAIEDRAEEMDAEEAAA